MDKTDVGLLAGFVGFAVSLWLGLSIAMQALVVLMVAPRLAVSGEVRREGPGREAA